MSFNNKNLLYYNLNDPKMEIYWNDKWNNDKN